MKNRDKDLTLPDLIVIGAQKCGTSALHYYLNQHHEINMSRPKELNFFTGTANWERGVDWYASHFLAKFKINGESCPQYSYFPKWSNVAKRMHSIIPEAKIIYLVRDPIERIISAYIQNYAEGTEDKGINEALADFENNPYLERTKYYFQITQYTEYYPLSRTLIISAEELQSSGEATIAKVLKYLNVNCENYKYRLNKEIHISRKKRRKNKVGRNITLLIRKLIGNRVHANIRWPIENVFNYPFSKQIERPHIDQSLQNEVLDYLKDDINKFRDLTGMAFDYWSI